MKTMIMDSILIEVSAILNQRFDTIPLLYGSYALQKVLDKDYQARDIDLLIDENILKNKIELISAFVMKGFAYIHQEVLTFEKNGIEIEISNLEKWIENSSFEIEENELIQESGSKFYLLSANNLKRLYQFLLSDKRRSNEKKQKDQEKLNDLRMFLER
ncbi:MAG: hypothetical protein KKH92_01005 [Firmicutes bacterium]|nr:hypothetical protein [Bacillota bacterium]